MAAAICSGSITSHRRLASEAGRAAGARCLAVGYRLAPEHPFPAALEDALRAWVALRRSGIEAGHIALAGDSAGGGLSVALANELREAGEEAPGCLWLVSPWTDLTCQARRLPARTRRTPGPQALSRRIGRLPMWPGRIERRDPRVSVLFADLARSAADISSRSARPRRCFPMPRASPKRRVRPMSM